MKRHGALQCVNRFRGLLRAWPLAILWTCAIALPIAESASPFGPPSCNSTSQCPFDQVCKNVGGAKKCTALSCNDNNGCPTDRPLCQSGKCQAPPNSGTGPGGSLPGGGTPGGSNTLGNVGEPCGPYKLGPTIKSRGCKPNLMCHKGTCQMPVQ